MFAAYIMAKELKNGAGDYRTAFRNYAGLLHDFIATKQRAAQRFSGSFAPRAKFGIFARTRVTDLMSLPFVARLALGPPLTDTVVLPSYDSR